MAFIPNESILMKAELGQGMIFLLSVSAADGRTTPQSHLDSSRTERQKGELGHSGGFRTSRLDGRHVEKVSSGCAGLVAPE